ncbi:hypothetical protein D3C72_1617010 [compost metagenome]
MVVAAEQGVDRPFQPAGEGVAIADREIALHGASLVVARVQLHGVRRETFGQQPVAGALGIG